MGSAEAGLTFGVIAGRTVGLVAAARSGPGRLTVFAGRLLALGIVGSEVSWWVWLAFQGTYRADFALPLQLCDIACLVSATALWTRRPLLVELTWFWGLAGTANGLVTPDLPQHFPDFLFLQYFLTHGGIVIAAFLLVVGLRISPRPWSSLRAFGLTFVLLLGDGLVDLALDANYLYLRRPPAVYSLLDLLGPWPWYIAAAAAIALVSFLLLELPFTLVRSRS